VFTDGDGCLGINIYKDNAYKRGWGVKLFFEIHLHKKDTDLLQKMKEFFNVGKVYNSKPNSSKYFFTSIADLQVVKNHFNNYTLKNLGFFNSLSKHKNPRIGKKWRK